MTPEWTGTQPPPAGLFEPCRDGHYVSWFSGSTTLSEPPEGTLCDCGRMKVAYQLCPHCGLRTWHLVPVGP